MEFNFATNAAQLGLKLMLVVHNSRKIDGVKSVIIPFPPHKNLEYENIDYIKSIQNYSGSNISPFLKPIQDI